MLSLLTNLFRPKFKTNEKEADNRLATLGDINSIVETLNKSPMFASKLFKFSVSHNTGTLETTGLARACKDGGSGCWSCLNSCGYQNADGAASFNETGTQGVYRLVVNTNDYAPYEDVSVQVGNMPNIGDLVAVKRLSATVFEITTKNVSQESPGRLFNNTLITIEFFTKKTDFITR